MNNEFVLSRCGFVCPTIKTNEKKGKKSYLPPMKRKKGGKKYGKKTQNQNNYNLTTTDGPPREREKGRERASEGNTNATTRRIVSVSVSFPRFYFRAPAPAPRVSRVHSRHRKKEILRRHSRGLIYDETSAFKLLVEG